MKDRNELTVSPLCLYFTPTAERRWTESIMGKDKASEMMLWGCHSEQEAEFIQGKRWDPPTHPHPHLPPPHGCLLSPALVWVVSSSPIHTLHREAYGGYVWTEHIQFLLSPLIIMGGY